MKLAARSWNAKPRARPRIPAPASSEVTALSAPMTPSAMKVPTAKTIT